MKLIWLFVPAALAAQSPDMETSIARQRASISRQSEAVRRQAGIVSAGLSAFFVLHSEPANETATSGDCAALTEFQLRPLLSSASATHGVHTDLLRAVIQQESAFRPCAVSSKGAQGLMQLMPATAAQFGVSDPFNPAESINAGAKLLSQLMKRYSGDLNRVLGAYNAGPANVDAVNGIPVFAETQNYVRSILKNFQPSTDEP